MPRARLMLQASSPERVRWGRGLLLAGALALGACVKPALVVGSSEQAALAPGEALLVVESESKVPWDQLTVRHASGARYALDLAGKGDRIGVYKLPAGAYTLIGAHLPLAYAKDRGFVQDPRFELRAGHLNYIGTLGFEFDADGGLHHHWRNRSGRVLTNFRALLPASADGLPFAYVGDEGDDWSSKMGEAR